MIREGVERGERGGERGGEWDRCILMGGADKDKRIKIATTMFTILRVGVGVGSRVGFISF